MKRIIAYLPILFVVLFVTSCSNDDYLNVIPKDVTVVASVDLAKMSKECDLGSSSVLDDLKKNMDGTKRNSCKANLNTIDITMFAIITIVEKPIDKKRCVFLLDLFINTKANM